MLVAFSALLNGCVTGVVWDEGEFARYHEPAVPSHLNLFHSGPRQDVLVVYDERRDGSEVIRSRAYWLRDNQDRIRDGRKPRFVAAKAPYELVPIPMTEMPRDTPPVAAPVLYAVASTNSPAFSLFSADGRRRDHQLPVYPDASGRVKQVLLTPLAVAADLSIVGAVIAYVTMPSWWEALNGIH